MFTPQKTLWSLTPRSEPGQNNGLISGPGSALNPNPGSSRNGGTLAKGKAVAHFATDGIMDLESLTERIATLENELFEYQYNMGLLLIEKKEWTLKNEELRQALADATDALKGEQAAHLSAISQAKKREENLKKTLGVERQSVFDLEKALREIQSEYAGIKLSADSRLAEANALVTSIEGKSLEVEAKLHAADAKLAEVSRKSSEIERKLHELEARENALRSERSSFIAEREAHDIAISKQREELREWKHSLQEAEERVANDRRLLTQREETTNEKNRSLSEKQNDIEERKKKIDVANSTLKKKEDDIGNRLASVLLKEKEADDARKKLEVKAAELLELEKKLDARERMDIEELLDEHKSTLAQKQKEFEEEMKQKRKLHDEQYRDKLREVEKKEAEITHMEEKVKKREQAVEKRLEKVREKEVDFDSKSKALREREKSLKFDEKKLEEKRKESLSEKENLLSVKAEIERLQADREKQLLRLNQEREQLNVTEHERTEFARLQLELKQEIEKCRFQSDKLNKEADDLKLEKEKFEKEWEELDDKRAEIKKEHEEFLKNKTYLEILRQSAEEKLQNEKQEAQRYVQRELDSLKLAEESFAATMELERSELAEKIKMEKSRLSLDFEQKKEQLKNDMQKRQEEMETRLRDREHSFDKERMKELENINSLGKVAKREMEKVELERQLLEKEKLEILQSKKHAKEQQYEMKKDIEDLVALSQNLKCQRKQFMEERERFIAFAEKQKSCTLCGETIREFILSNRRAFTEMENLVAPPLPSIADNYLKEAVEGTSERLNYDTSTVVTNSGSPSAVGTFSWLRKCTSKILKFSPGKKLELDSSQDPTGASSLFVKQIEVASQQSRPSGENEPEPSLQVANDSFDVQVIESDNGIKEPEAVSVDQRPLDIPESLQDSNLKQRYHGRGMGGRSRPSRTRSVKAVIAGARTILGESPEQIENQHSNGDAENSVYTNEDSRAESELGVTQSNRRKRNRGNVSQALADDNLSEGHSDSVKNVDRPKRQRKGVAGEQSLGPKRYNLRQNRRSVAMVANAMPRARKGKEKESKELPDREIHPSVNVETGGVSKGDIHEPGSAASPVGAGDGRDPMRSNEAASAFSADSPEKEFKNALGTPGGHLGTVNTSVDDMVLSEEVNGIETGVDYTGEEFKNENNGEEDNDDGGDDDNDAADDDDDGDGDEHDHPVEVSVGKKIWTFFTT